MIKLFAFGLLIATLSGCASSPNSGAGFFAEKPVTDKMSKLADDIKRELIIQNRMNLSGGDFATGKKITIDFEGTVSDFARNLSEMGFTVRTIGKKPAFDLYLNLHHDQVKIYFILEDAATQLPGFVHIDMYADDEIVISYEA